MNHPGGAALVFRTNGDTFWLGRFGGRGGGGGGGGPENPVMVVVGKIAKEQL